MRIVTWTDRDGYRRRSMVRDQDPDTEAVRGLPMEPPDLSQLDWEGVKRDIHNAFVDQGVITLRDMQRLDNLRSVIVSALKPRIIALFKQQVEDTT